MSPTEPLRPLLVFAPGAGASSASAFMQRWARRLGAWSSVEVFDYPYMQRGRRAPDKLPRLIEAHRDAVAAARERHGRDRPLVLIGKSMGSRIGCHVALGVPEGDAPRALVCLGYPLRGQSGAVRDEVLLALRRPILFIQGTRDPLGPLDLFASVRARMTAPSELFVVEGGDHSLALRKGDLVRQKTTPDAIDAAVDARIRAFVEKHLGQKP